MTAGSGNRVGNQRQPKLGKLDRKYNHLLSGFSKAKGLVFALDLSVIGSGVDNLVKFEKPAKSYLV